MHFSPFFKVLGCAEKQHLSSGAFLGALLTEVRSFWSYVLCLVTSILQLHLCDHCHGSKPLRWKGQRPPGHAAGPPLGRPASADVPVPQHRVTKNICIHKKTNKCPQVPGVPQWMSLLYSEWLFLFLLLSNISYFLKTKPIYSGKSQNIFILSLKITVSLTFQSFPSPNTATTKGSCGGNACSALLKHVPRASRSQPNTCLPGLWIYLA